MAESGIRVFKFGVASSWWLNMIAFRWKMGHHRQINYVQLAGELLRSKHVAIVGNQGAGKTTLAKRLQGLLGIDYVEILWHSEKITPSEVQEIRERMVQRDNWIIDGDFGLLDLADKVIFLDFPLFVCLRRAIGRSINNFLTRIMHRRLADVA